MGEYVLTVALWRHIVMDGKVTVESTKYFKGDHFELDDDEAQRLVDGGAALTVEDFESQEALRDAEQPVVAESTPEPAEVEEDPTTGQDEYATMEYGDLQEAAKARGLSATGSKEALRDRLRESE